MMDSQSATRVDLVAEQEERLREFIRAHPLPVVLGALLLGFAIAKAVRGESSA